MIKKATTFLRSLFNFRKAHMDRWIAVLTTTPNFLLQKGDDFLLNFQKFWTKRQKKGSGRYLKIANFCFSFQQKKCVSLSRCFNVQVECSSENPVKNMDERPEVACSLSENDRKRHSFKRIPWICKFKCYNPDNFFSDKSNQSFANDSNMWVCL